MKIKRLRVQREMTQEALAKKVRISRVHLSNLESADNAPTTGRRPWPCSNAWPGPSSCR